MQREQAEAILREAGELALSYFSQRACLRVERKARQDLVSEADREVESLIRRRIQAACPRDRLLGEEFGLAASGQGDDSNASIWVIDPIDGTTNFLRGIPEFAITLCRVCDGAPDIGLIYHPVNQEMLFAARSQGAWRNGVRHQIEPTPVTLDSAVLGLGYNLRPGNAQRAIAMMRSWTEAGCVTRQTGSAAVGISQAILGRTDAFYEPQLNSWDALAGQLIATEAGLHSSPYLSGERLTRGGPVWIARPELFDLVREEETAW
ncbi:Archaeal fructose-1,6-bisphosphatase and related enzyme of inositol monophosphatase family [Hahella chejuensis KCTC 2396]|uniref:Nus factor SuhB n=1 Tax=Hahella chejuensis (strain KCTC 2396) TaxID=349521 RepID=Q2SH18_HAHCH|nr:inositol monophosphatase family protein [Hahella chejuensis]ABC30056.1 Archaeal fructose-1,6-bisphosphatase and related enzyme of inositol monophosphatase family [Hahella chejuensis KCTC 2396]